MKRIVIDTDAGVDDALALILAIRSPELKIEAITTVSGNVHVDLCAENVLRVLDLLELESPPPVAKGEAGPLERPLLTAPEVHGEDGFGGLHELMEESGALRYTKPSGEILPKPAWEVLAELAGQTCPTELSLITLGPLTNIAKAIMNNPTAMRGYSEIICMGGAFEVPGNTTLTGEFNIVADPHAAQIVLESQIPITFVPLDVTQKTCLQPEDVRPSQSRLSRFLADVTEGIMHYHITTEGFHGCYLHDPLAVGVGIDPSFVTMSEAHVHIDDEGTTTIEPGTPNARVCTEVDNERFLQFFLERVTHS